MQNGTESLAAFQVSHKQARVHHDKHLGCTRVKCNAVHDIAEMEAADTAAVSLKDVYAVILKAAQVTTPAAAHWRNSFSQQKRSDAAMSTGF